MHTNIYEQGILHGVIFSSEKKREIKDKALINYYPMEYDPAMKS